MFSYVQKLYFLLILFNTILLRLVCLAELWSEQCSAPAPFGSYFLLLIRSACSGAGVWTTVLANILAQGWPTQNLMGPLLGGHKFSGAVK